MAKYMYQKRKETKENNTEVSNNKMNINWDISTDAKLHSNPYEIRKVEKIVCYIFNKKEINYEDYRNNRFMDRTDGQPL